MKKQIPLSCFNHRFFVQPVEEHDDDVHDDDDDDDDDDELFEEEEEEENEEGDDEEEDDEKEKEEEEDDDDDDDDEDDDDDDDVGDDDDDVDDDDDEDEDDEEEENFQEAPAAAAASAAFQYEFDGQRDEEERLQEKDDDVIIINGEDDDDLDVEQTEERRKEKDYDGVFSLQTDYNNQSQMQSILEEPSVKTKSSRNQMVLDSVDEIVLYKQLRTSAETLLKLRAIPEFEPKAIILATRLSGLVDGYSLYHCAETKKFSCPVDDYQVEEDKAVLVLAGDSRTKSLRDELHITSAGLDSRFSSDEMIEFRGSLRALILRLIQLKRDLAAGIDSTIQLFHKMITELSDECTYTPGNSKACLAPVHGRLRPDSYKTVPIAVNRNCRKSLQQARALETMFISGESDSCDHPVPDIPSEDDSVFESSLEPSLLLPSEQQHSTATCLFSTRKVGESVNSAFIHENQGNDSVSHTKNTRNGKKRRRPSSSS